jgi:hypothetical protein
MDSKKIDEEIQEELTNQDDVKKKKRSYKKHLILVGIFGISLLAILSVNFFKDPLIAKVQGQSIHLSDIRKVASEEYEPQTIDKGALKISYDILTERLILDHEAELLHLTVSDQELKDALARIYTSSEEIPDAIKINTKYDLLRKKILQEEVESREAYSIAVYLPSKQIEKGLNLSQKEKILLEKQRSDVAKALSEIEQRLKMGENPLAVATLISNKYPSLRPILSINGATLESANKNIALVPEIYEYEKENIGQPFFDLLYSMHPNETKIMIDNIDGSGGYVIQMKRVTHSEKKTYEEWLAFKKNQMLKKEKDL